MTLKEHRGSMRVCVCVCPPPTDGLVCLQPTCSLCLLAGGTMVFLSLIKNVQ